MSDPTPSIEKDLSAGSDTPSGEEEALTVASDERETPEETPPGSDSTSDAKSPAKEADSDGDDSDGDDSHGDDVGADQDDAEEEEDDDLPEYGYDLVQEIERTSDVRTWPAHDGLQRALTFLNQGDNKSARREIQGIQGESVEVMRAKAELQKRLAPDRFALAVFGSALLLFFIVAYLAFTHSP